MAVNSPGKKVLNQSQVRAAIDKLAKQIRKAVKEPASDWVLVGVQRRGVPLAERLARALEESGGPSIPVGTLDITLYRDDTNETGPQPVVHDTNIPFDLSDKTVFLVDDVLFTGRTVRCALDELMDLGRPRRVYLAVLVDRGHRELPIAADFAAESLPLPPPERVEVRLEEVDGEDAVWTTRAPRKNDLLEEVP